LRVPKKTIVDNIEQIIAASRTARRKTWLDNIPADVRSSLEQVREKHRANEYKVCKTAVIKAIQAALAEHGLTPPSQDTVQRWLERD
jgi:hypothetical protein